MARVNNKNVNIWSYKRDKKIYDAIEDKTYKYFDDLFIEEGTELESKNGLVYREGQHNYALDVVDAIRNNKILLIQAGVGIGKSFGYLVPIMYTIDGVKGEKNIKFDKVVISTSNIALQHQLIRDIDKISEMIGITIRAVIAKGVNNYACIKRIEKTINSSTIFEKRKQELKDILAMIEKNNSSDRADLAEISEAVWKNIQLCSRGYCSNCAYSKNCSFFKNEEAIKKSNIIITNHANYITNVFKWDIDGLIIDEAHKFDENLINVLKEEVKLKNIFINLEKIYSYVENNSYDNEIILEDYRNIIEDIKVNFMYLFAYIKDSAVRSFNKNNRNNNSVTDGDRMSFKFNKDILEMVSYTKGKIDNLLDTLKGVESIDKFGENKKEEIVKYFTIICNVLNDMLLGRESKNIYWVSFFNEESINLGYVPKDKSLVVKKLFEKSMPVVFTSATMLDSNDSYSYFINKVGLDRVNRNIEQAEEQVSPFDYDNNALLYYDKTVAVPNEREQNIMDLASKISELIRITNGKALVLFTSKKRMKEVYDLMMQEEFPFKVLIQSEGNSDSVRKEFENDTDTCLFATGSFWEGISINGNSLSNLIITHLPFDNVDAINKYEASKYINRHERLKHVYVPDMLIKMKQAIGRLIRSDSDTGIVCCLDSRMENYLEGIRSVSPIKNITTNIRDVYEFSDRKITNTNNRCLIKTCKITEVK